MSVFAFVIPGQALQTAVQLPEAPERFVGQIAGASSLNHLCVFLTSPFPEGYGCTLHLGLPGKDFQLIGSLSNQKPSTILRLRGTFVASTQTAGHFSAGAPGMPNQQDVGTLGIVCEPLEEVQRQVAALGAAKADVGAPTSTALVLAGSSQSPDPVTLAQKVALNLVQHVMGFVKEDGAGGSWIDLRVVQNWYTSFERKLKAGGVGFLLSSD